MVHTKYEQDKRTPTKLKRRQLDKGKAEIITVAPFQSDQSDEYGNCSLVNKIFSLSSPIYILWTDAKYRSIGYSATVWNYDLTSSVRCGFHSM